MIKYDIQAIQAPTHTVMHQDLRICDIHLAASGRFFFPAWIDAVAKSQVGNHWLDPSLELEYHCKPQWNKLATFEHFGNYHILLLFESITNRWMDGYDR